MSFSLKGDDTFYIFDYKIVACALVFGGKLLYNGTLGKCHVVLVGGKDIVGILLSGLFNHGEQTAFHLFAVNDKYSTEYFMAAVLGIDLSEAENFRVSEGTL